jgi:hypothetical protein
VNPLEPKVLALGVAATTVMFVAVAFFSRATPRRIVGALLGAVPVIPWVVLCDAIARRFGWWHYPSVTTDIAPLAWYVAAALWYGAALGLVGWRVIRRFGRLGLTAFLSALAVLGVARDYLYSVTTGLIVFGSGAIPLVADFLAYALAAAAVQIAMYWIAGLPRSDRLARGRRRRDRPDSSVEGGR